MADPGSATVVRPRVAMFVMNPCVNDARVQREAQTLAAAGAQVRVFAFATAAHPEGLFSMDGFEVQRLRVSSVYVTLLSRLSAARIRIATADTPTAADSPIWLVRALRRVDAMGARAAARAMILLISPLALLLRLGPRVVPAGRLPRLRRLVRRLRKWTGRHMTRPAVRESFDGARVEALWHAARGDVERVLAAGVQVLAAIRRRVRARLAVAVRRRLRVIHHPSVLMNFWKASALAAVEWRPDVVHAHDLNTLPAAARVARRLGARLVYDSHELWRHRNRHGELRPVGRMVDAVMERSLVRRADAVITVSPSIADWMARHYRLARRPWVVRNIPSRRGQDCRPPETSLRALPDLGDKRLLLYTGRITGARGLEEAVEALPLLPDDVVLVMLGYGDATFLGGLLERVEALGVQERVRVVPAVEPDQVATVAAEADVALVAIQPNCLSYRFSLPNKLFEAVQAGLPVAATDLPDIGALVREHGLGTLFAPSDPRALAAAVLEVMANGSRMRAAVRTAGLELCWERERERLLELYRELVVLPGQAAALGSGAPHVSP